MAIAKCTTDLPGTDVPIPSQSCETLDSRHLKIRDWRPSARWPQRTEPAPMPCLHLQGRWLERARLRDRRERARAGHAAAPGRGGV
jgi:hypothetical protein